MADAKTKAAAAPKTAAKTAVSTLTSAKIFDADPKKIKIIAGFNVRKVDPAHVESLTKAYLNNKPVPPVLVAVAEDGSLELVDGEHRTLAAIAAKRKLIPVMSFEGTEQERVGIAISSSQGKNLSPDERAGGYLRLRNDGWTDKDIAEFTGRSEGDVANHLLLAQCGPQVLAKVADGTIKATPIFKLAREIGPENVWGKLEAVMNAKAVEAAEEEALAANTAESAQEGQGKAQAKGKGKATAKAKKGAKGKTAAAKGKGKGKAKITEADLLTSFGKKEAMRVSELATYFSFVGTATAEGKETHTYTVPAEVSTELSALVKRYLAGQPGTVTTA